MDDLSRRVTSSQTGPHQRLVETVRRHQSTTYRRPIAEHTKRAFERVAAGVSSSSRPLILDAGCGTGQATVALARRNPRASVFGVDRSALRLSRDKGEAMPDNCYLVRAALEDWFRLARQAGWRFRQTWIICPNPYPKPTHLQRRWHAHPIFPTILAVSDAVTLRTNWAIYADEFVLALSEYGVSTAVESPNSTELMSRFEQKYVRSGHQLFQVQATIGSIS